MYTPITDPIFKKENKIWINYILTIDKLVKIKEKGILTNNANKDKGKTKRNYKSTKIKTKS